MANGILVLGRPGSGKSTSSSTLDPNSTFFINVASKGLPMKGWKKTYKMFNSKDKTGNLVNHSDPEVILKVMEMIDKDLLHIKDLIIDDFQYMSAFEFMNRSHEIGYQKFTDIAKHMFLVATAFKDMREDLNVYYLTHEDETTEENGDAKIKAKTVGKLIDNMISLEGLFTIVLHASAKKVKDEVDYFFSTQTDGRTTAKSPRGMFESKRIPNDLSLVSKAIADYEE